MEINFEYTCGVIIFIILLLNLIGVAVAVAFDKNLSKKRKLIMALLVIFSFVLIIANYGETITEQYVANKMLRILFAIIGYSLRPAIIVLFVELIDTERRHIPAWVLVGVNFILHTTAFYSELVFTISRYNYYVGGPLKYTCLVISSILFAYSLFVVFREFRTGDNKKNFVTLIFIALAILGIVLDIIKYPWTIHWVDYLTIMVVECCIFFYLWLHFILEQKYKEAIMTEKRYQTMISQLQPHFIYNTLSAITAIDNMPDEAKNAIYDFSAYLRQNLDAITTKDLVPFEKELEHIKKYINLEKLRFDDKINVVFDIKDIDFSLPALTIQLLVENAIKHGITQKDEGGTVHIITEKDDKNHIVVVSDDGVGFDLDEDISGSHFGLNNISKRLEYTIGGTLTITSEKGKGTTAKVFIPIKK